MRCIAAVVSAKCDIGSGLGQFMLFSKGWTGQAIGSCGCQAGKRETKAGQGPSTLLFVPDFPLGFKGAHSVSKEYLALLFVYPGPVRVRMRHVRPSMASCVHADLLVRI